MMVGGGHQHASLSPLLLLCCLPPGALPLPVILHPPAGHSLLSSLSFSWVNPLMRLGARRQLQPADLLLLDPLLEPAACADLLWLQWCKVGG